jgi:hypothetical protein
MANVTAIVLTTVVAIVVGRAPAHADVVAGINLKYSNEGLRLLLGSHWS